MKRTLAIVLAAAVLVSLLYWWRHRPAGPMVLTGLVDGEVVVVGSQITGQVEKLAVQTGSRVQAGQILALLNPSELSAGLASAQAQAATAGRTVSESEAQTRLLLGSLDAQVAQVRQQVAAATAALAQARANLASVAASEQKVVPLVKQGIFSQLQGEQAKASLAAAQAAVRQAERSRAAAQAALRNAVAQRQQIKIQRIKTQALVASQRSAQAQARMAAARLQYTTITSPVGGVVTLRVARQGEIVTPGSAIVAIYDLGDTWVDAYVPETEADAIVLGEKVTVRLPSGREIPGTVYYKATEAGFATQRDVSETKRDIRTVAIRVRVDNRQGRLVRGMTAWVVAPR